MPATAHPGSSLINLTTSKTTRKPSLSMDIKPSSSPGTASVASFRSRAESETDYEDIVAPRPRHLHSPTWLREFDDATNVPEQPPRVSSPLNPNRQARKMSFPYSPSISQSTHPSMLNHRARVESFSGPSSLHDARMESPIRRWVRWMAKVHMRDWVLPMAITVAVLLRWAVGLGGYSGRNAPPMHGDYEAQRHWMEITYHLPTREWYFYDLPYWGLDYPPLTAYVSYACGLVAHLVNPAWVAMGASRGFEDPDSKTFMRATVLALDCFIYIPATVWFTRTWWKSRSRRTQNIAALTIILQPSLILIDSGHFQYNSVMLGLTVLCLNFINSGHDSLAAIAFVLSLCFKQMALYFSPAIFAYLLGRCIMLPPAKGLSHLVKIGVTTVVSFLVMFSPFILQSFPTLLLQTLVRIFPFSRGLFEDKVANFWCATNVVVKWRRYLSPQSLPKIATIVTLVSILPPVLHILAVSWGLREVAEPPMPQVSPDLGPSDESPGGLFSGSGVSPSRPKQHTWPSRQTTLTSTESLMPKNAPSPTVGLLLHALFNCSMAFFLFSFQVHEKSILLPLLPLTLLMSGRSEIDVDSGMWEWGVLINNVGLFSMWPLLKKDGLGLQYATVAALWNYAIGHNPAELPGSLVKYLSLVVYAAIASLHMGEMLIVPPTRYPDLFPVLNVLLCSGVFGIGWLWGMKKQMEAGWGISGLQTPRKSKLADGSEGRLAAVAVGSPSSNRRFTMDARALGNRRGGDGDGGLRLRKRESIPAGMFLNKGNANGQ